MTAKDFQAKYGKQKTLRKKSNAEINAEMTASFLAQCEDAGLPKPLCEFKFHHDRKWRIDFCFVTKAKIVAVEIEGFGHHHLKDYFKDIEKYNELSHAGILLLRFTVKDVETGYAIAQIRRILWVVIA